MFETNTQNNSVLISLSRAAQLTGYHQDYLGQLCRLGKLPATKKGRVWFTSAEALNKLSAVPQIDDSAAADADEVIAPQEIDINFEYTEPAISQNVTVSQVEGLPISIRTMPSAARGANNVQNILTTMRIESLQQEVLELRQMLIKLMAEVTKHADLLQGRSQAKQSDLLRHAYISNFDFSPPGARVNNAQQEDAPAPQQLEAPAREERAPRRGLLVFVVSAAAVVAAIAVVGSSLLYGQFLGDSEAQVSTIYYHTNELAESAETPLQPTVAGDTLPTVPAGDLR